MLVYLFLTITPIAPEADCGFGRPQDLLQMVRNPPACPESEPEVASLHGEFLSLLERMPPRVRMTAAEIMRRRYPAG